METAEPVPAPKKQRKPKPYVPAFRSGPYAILLALATLDEDSDERLTKAQIIGLAQEHCDSSFSAPSEPGKFYTAWNSMKTLEDKDLVHARGRPSRRYALTEEGWDVARRIKRTAEESIMNPTTRAPAKPQEDAAPKVKTPMAVSKPSKYTTFGDFLDIEDDLEAIEGLPNLSHPVQSTALTERSSSIGTGEAGYRLGGAPVDKFGTFAPAKERQPRPPREYLEIHSSPEPQPAQRPPVSQRPAARRQTEAYKAAEPTKGRPRSPHQHGSSITKTAFPDFQPILLHPGNFSVKLVLDTREVRSKDDRDYIEKELVKKGIKPEVRPLELGDFFWVAKCNDPNLLSRYGEEGDEIALDWIVERKRLDDLVGSVKDGRFSEQKFRLRRSGVNNVVYLVEELTLSSEQATKYHEMMESAIASTQVVDGYFVKRTAKLDDTIRYIARMTTMLKSLYEGKPLQLIPSSHLDPSTYLRFLNHLRSTHPDPYHITYDSFASMASKSDSLTLRDVYLKMLMCIRGVSGEKAIEIQKIWPTPKALLEAYERCAGQKHRDGMVEGRLRDHPVGRRKIGKQLSMKIAAIWGETSESLSR